MPPWEKYGGQQNAGPWAKYGGEKKRSVGDDVLGAVVTFNRNFVPFSDELSDGLTAVVNRATGQAKTLKEGWDQARKVTNEAEASFAKARPNAAAFTRGTGNASTMVLPAAPGLNALAQGTRGVNMGRAALVGAAEGAAYGLGDRGTLNERLGSANRNALLGGAFGGAAGSLAPATRRPVKRVDPNVRKLAEEGVQMTPGQMRGGMAKTLEDQATSLPILGPAIQEARQSSLNSMNRAIANRTLKPVGETLPDGIEAGTDAIKYVGDRLSAGYEKAIPQRTIRADPAFADDARAAMANVNTMTPAAVERLNNIIDQRVTSRLGQGGVMDGATFKQIQSELSYEASRFKGAQDPDLREIGAILDNVRGALDGAARRQDPQFARTMDELDAGWAELTRLENAASKAGVEGGIVTPSQYDGAVRMGDKRVRRRGYARGEALGQDFSSAAKAVLPSKVPNSGTADRTGLGAALSVPGAIMGTMAGGPVGGAIGGTVALGGLTAARSMYSPRAIEAANRALNARIGREGQQVALRELEALAAQSPQAAQLYRTVLAKLGRASGATAGQSNALLGAGPAQ